MYCTTRFNCALIDSCSSTKSLNSSCRLKLVLPVRFALYPPNDFFLRALPPLPSNIKIHLVGLNCLIVAAIDERSQARVYLSITAFALASVQLLLHMYPETYLSSNTLAIITTSVAIFCWVLELQVRKRSTSIVELFVGPLSNTSLILSVASLMFTTFTLSLTDFMNPDYELFIVLSVLSTINLIVLSRFNNNDISPSLSLFSAWTASHCIVLNFLSLHSSVEWNSQTAGWLALILQLDL